MTISRTRGHRQPNVYQGQGWGLLQVLETINEGPALDQFKTAAAQVLTRRVQNAPPGTA
jgi:hypothetical protein